MIASPVIDLQLARKVLQTEAAAILAKVPEGDVDKLMRVELVLRGYSFNRDARRQLVNSDAMFIPEGSYGPIVSGLVTPSRVPALAQAISWLTSDRASVRAHSRLVRRCGKRT